MNQEIFYNKGDYQMITSILYIVMLVLLVSFYRYIKKAIGFKKAEKDGRNNKALIIFLKSVIRTILKHIRLVIVTYLGLIGVYIAMERIQRYQVFPYSIHEIKTFIDIMTDIGAKKFMYTMMKSYFPFYYFVFILPKDVMMLYDEWRYLYKKEDVFVKMWDKIEKMISKQREDSNKLYGGRHDRKR